MSKVDDSITEGTVSQVASTKKILKSMHLLTSRVPAIAKVATQKTLSFIRFYQTHINF